MTTQSKPIPRHLQLEATGYLEALNTYMKRFVDNPLDEHLKMVPYTMQRYQEARRAIMDHKVKAVCERLDKQQGEQR